MIRIIYNRLLGGWFIVRGPHQTPIGGRFSTREEAKAHLAFHKTDGAERPLRCPGCGGWHGRGGCA